MPENKGTILEDSDTNNPYLEAARLLYTRIKWDLHPESWRSRARMKSLKNKYVGKKCVIVCNGPSLRHSNLSLLSSTFTIGMNKINLLFEHDAFRPSCIVTIDKLAVSQNIDFLRNTTIPLFLSHQVIDVIPPKKGNTYLHLVRTKKFARDLSMSFYAGTTATFMALQLAFHLGFDEVALIGCDNFYQTPQKVGAHEGKARFEAIRVDGEERDHFIPGYIKPGESMMHPNYNENEYNFRLAKEQFESFGRKVYNCTVGGHLEVFDRMQLEDFLK
jgi:hypothetical protein